MYYILKSNSSKLLRNYAVLREDSIELIHIRWGESIEYILHNFKDYSITAKESRISSILSTYGLHIIYNSESVPTLEAIKKFNPELLV